MHATSDNGAIIMKQVEENVRSKTDNGRIHLLTADVERNIALETGNSTILLETKTEPKNATIRAEVDWGSSSVLGLKKEKAFSETEIIPWTYSRKMGRLQFSWRIEKIDPVKK